MTIPKIEREVKACFLDFDGTLVKTTKHGIQSTKRVSKKLGLAVPDSETIIRAMNLAIGLANYLEYLWPGQGVRENDYDRVYRECKFDIIPIPPVPGARKTVNFLRMREIFLGIISNREQASVEKRLRQIDIKPEWFNIIQAPESGTQCFYKPDPWILNNPCLEIYRSGHCLEETIHVGDTLVDYETTVDTPIGFVGVLSGFTTREEFLDAGVQESHILNSVAELPQFLGFGS